MKEKQFIKCPVCGSVEMASIDHSTVPFSTFIHDCSKCNHTIMESEWEPLRALSIKQPWAWLILNGIKDIENRTWQTKFRGTILIHAGKQVDKKGYDFVADAFYEAGKIKDLPTIKEFENWTGGICGHVEITGCVSKSNSPWFFGPYGFTLKNPQMMDIIPCKGQLSFFTPKIIE